MWLAYLITVQLRAFCIMSQRVTLYSEVKPLGVAEVKASLNRAKVI